MIYLKLRLSSHSLGFMLMLNPGSTQRAYNASMELCSVAIRDTGTKAQRQEVVGFFSSVQWNRCRGEKWRMCSSLWSCNGAGCQTRRKPIIEATNRRTATLKKLLVTGMSLFLYVTSISHILYKSGRSFQTTWLIIQMLSRVESAAFGRY